ncbi:MAG TPA: family 16 glycosylhydrolase [Polyangia bacterium]|nr:family 16 glycosylhydrolase [Polyangia bacterium]
MSLTRRLPLPGWAAAAAALVSTLAPASAFAVQSAELYRTDAYFYGRFEARVQFAPGEGVVSSFFLWKNGSSSTTSWNELDYEKINAACQLQTNIWSGTGTQSAQLTSPTADLCGGYHTYSFEWTPDYIAWFVDGTQLRRETGSVVAEYTQNASQGMTIHFNTWVGNASFGGVLDPSILPVNEYIDWVQYSSYANGAFQQQWREDFDGTGIPDGWAVGNWQSPYGLSTHNPANVNFVNGVAVLSLTADGATGYTGTPPTDLQTDGGAVAPSPDGGAAPASGSGGGCGCDTVNAGRFGLPELAALILGIAGARVRRRSSSRSRARSRAAQFAG